MRAHIHVDLAETALDEFRDRLPRRRRGVRSVGKRHLGIEEALDGAVALGAEGLVVAIWHFKGARGGILGGFEVVAALGVVARYAAAGPDLDDGFFEFGQEPVFLESAEGEVGRGSVGEGAECGLCGGEGFDGGFGGYEIVWVEWDLGSGG